MELSEIVSGQMEAGACGQVDARYALEKQRAILAQYQRPTLAERVSQTIAHHEQEIAKLREVETLLTENPEIEKLISALGSANIRF